jgi:hypothetical protein
MSMAALEALLWERLESDRQDEEALKALGQAEAKNKMKHKRPCQDNC